jgi:arylsulfatase
MKALWWTEAERFQVLPLNNNVGFWGDPRHRRNHYVFRGHAGPLDAGVAPHAHNRSFTITGHLAPGERDTLAGIVVAHGSHAGGYVCFLMDGRLGFTYNYVATQITSVVAETPLPTSPVTVRVVFTRTGPGGDVELFYDDVPVGRGVVPVTTPLTYGSPGFAVGFQPSGPIDRRLVGRAEMPPGVLRAVEVDTSGRDPIRDALLDPRVDLATQ